MPLSHRERVIKSLSHQEPDRIPFDLGSTVNSSIHILAYQKLKAHFGIEVEDSLINKMMQVVSVHEPILQALDIDFRLVMIGSSDSQSEIPVGADGYQDGWGTIFHKPPRSHYYDVAKSPLAGPITIQDIVKYPTPDPTDPGYTRGLRERLLQYRENTDYAIVLRIPTRNNWFLLFIRLIWY